MPKDGNDYHGLKYHTDALISQSNYVQSVLPLAVPLNEAVSLESY